MADIKEDIVEKIVANLEDILQQHGLEIIYTKTDPYKKPYNEGLEVGVKVTVCLMYKKSMCRISSEYYVSGQFRMMFEEYLTDDEWMFDWLVYNGQSSCISSTTKHNSLQDLISKIKKYSNDKEIDE